MKKSGREPIVELRSVITCPACGFQKEELMPVEACQHFYQCTNCKVMLRPRQGDCCVFCSYGSMKCPSMQVELDGFENEF